MTDTQKQNSKTSQEKKGKLHFCNGKENEEMSENTLMRPLLPKIKSKYYRFSNERLKKNTDEIKKNTCLHTLREHAVLNM